LCVLVVLVTTGAARALHEATAHHHHGILDDADAASSVTPGHARADHDGDDDADGPSSRRHTPHHDHDDGHCATCAELAAISSSAGLPSPAAHTGVTELVAIAPQQKPAVPSVASIPDPACPRGPPAI
jgi:hypothetical protein